jgi:hypothetical protein
VVDFASAAVSNFSEPIRQQTGANQMRLIPEDKAALIKCLIGQPDDRTVEPKADTGILATTVKELRELPSWPGGLVVTTPREDHPDLVVKISKKKD